MKHAKMKSKRRYYKNYFYRFYAKNWTYIYRIDYPNWLFDIYSIKI